MSAHDAPPDRLSAKGTRLNRRGLETRRRLLKVAVRCLADGGPGAVSANLVAKQAGVTWGTVQHQFGDVDGLWAAVLEHTATEGGMFPHVPDQPDLGERVDAVVDMLWQAHGLPISRAIYNLRTALPLQRPELETTFPRTAAAIADCERDWTDVVERAFDGLAVDRVRLARVRALLPSAVQGLHVEHRLSTYLDIDEALVGLREAVTAYLS